MHWIIKSVLAFIAANYLSVALADEANLPECVHRLAPFVLTQFLDQAKVNGKPEQRLYLHPANPQLCDTPESGDCRSKGYVITGDVVTVGTICGPWAQIEYKSKRSKFSRGWVEANRLDKIAPTKNAMAERERFSIPYQRMERNELFQALNKGDDLQIKGLLKTKKDWFIALDGAIGMIRLDYVQHLIRLGANLNDYDNSCELLRRAVTSSPEILLTIIKAGGNVNCSITIGAQKLTPLYYVARFNRSSVIPMWAADNPAPDLVGMAKVLIDSGTDLKTQDVWGGTAVRWTLESNNVDVAQYLLDRKADINNYLDSSAMPGNVDANAIGNEHGNTTIMEAIWWYPLRNDPSMIKLLLQRGADVNYKNADEYHDPNEEGIKHYRFASGQTALTIAASSGYTTIVKLLLEYGADPNIPRQDGKTALELADENHHFEVSNLIKDKAKN